MPGYVLNSDTLGFYKFSSNGSWNKNSMVNTSISIEGFEKIENLSSNWGAIQTYTPDFIKSIHKSRPSAILLKENTGINITQNSGTSMTTEFWFYAKKGTNNNIPANYSTYNTSLNTASLSNPFLLALDMVPNYIDPFWNTERLYWTVTYTGGRPSDQSSNTSYHYKFPVFINLGYCAVRNIFGFSVINSMLSSSGGTGLNQQSYTKNYCPPNRWYHIAITQQQNGLYSGTICLFINGIKCCEKTVSSGVGSTSRTKSGRYKNYYYAQLDMSLTNSITIGNRCTYKPYGVYAYKSSERGFQDVIIDDLRITKGILYTGDFTPPGMTGYQLAYVNDDVYGYDDTYQFVKIASGWDAKTPAQKQSIINTMGMMDIVIDDLKSIPMNPGDDLHMEVYAKDPTQLSCELIDNSYETTVVPSTLLSNPLPGSEVRRLEFTSSLSEDSYIKILLTKDLSTYQTYDFTNSQWVNCDISDISTQGISINQVKNIPKADMTSLGDSFAFAYFLHLEPYEADCSIDKLDISISLTYGWEHQNQSKANYEYPMLSQLKVVFYEDGDFKVNYMDKP